MMKHQIGWKKDGLQHECDGTIAYRRVRIAGDSQEHGFSVWLASMCIGGRRPCLHKPALMVRESFCQGCTDAPRRMVCWAVKMMA